MSSDHPDKHPKVSNLKDELNQEETKYLAIFNVQSVPVYAAFDSKELAVKWIEGQDPVTIQSLVLLEVGGVFVPKPYYKI